MTAHPGSRDRRAAHEERRARRAAVTDPAIALEAAAQFLTARSRSVAETRRRLLHLGYSETVTEEVLGRLGQLGYLDDRTFARAWVESRDRSRPRGEMALRQELRRKGVDESVVREVLGARAEALQDAGPDARPPGEGRLDVSRSADREAARRLLARRSASLAREPDPRKRRQRAYALLARHGFDPTICRDESLSLPGASADDAEPDPEGDP